MAAPATTLPANAANCIAPATSKPPSAALLVALADADVDVDEELEDEEVGVGAAVRTWPAKEVVKPEAVPVATVTAAPPTEVTSTMGTPLEAVKICQRGVSSVSMDR